MEVTLYTRYILTGLVEEVRNGKVRYERQLPIVATNVGYYNENVGLIDRDHRLLMDIRCPLLGIAYHANGKI